MFEELLKKGKTFVESLKEDSQVDSYEVKEWVANSVVQIEHTLEESTLLKTVQEANEDFNDLSINKIENILAILNAANKLRLQKEEENRKNLEAFTSLNF